MNKTKSDQTFSVTFEFFSNFVYQTCIKAEFKTVEMEQGPIIGI